MNASFVYGGLGRREKKTINGSLTEFLYDGVNPVQETSGAAVLANILPGLGIDEFFARTDVGAGTTSTLLSDALGSTIALADSAGTIQTENIYEPFGRTTVTGTSNSNPLQYTSRENDGTGLYYYRARYYHPELQRFISEDTFPGYLTLPQSLNWYLYVLNNPLLFIDPFGFDKCSNPTMAKCNPPKPTPPPCKVKDIGVRAECTPPNPPGLSRPQAPEEPQPPPTAEEAPFPVDETCDFLGAACEAFGGDPVGCSILATMCKSMGKNAGDKSPSGPKKIASVFQR